MAAPRKWSDDVRAAIHELVNEQGRPATELAPLLEARGLDIPPLETIRDIARNTRLTITDKPKPEQLRQLTGRAVRVIDAEFARIEATSEPADADEIQKLVRSLRELEPLLSDKPASSTKEQRDTTLGGLSSVPTGEGSATQATPAAVRSLRT